jgi:hypothetical protein
MRPLSFRSRAGNVALAAAGTIYLLAAMALLVWYVVTSWSAAHLLDRVLQFGLICAGVVGLFFLALAAPKLGIGTHRR